jgi:hypothetical protein
MSAPVEVPVPSLAPLQKGTAVLLMDDWDGNKLKTAYVLSKVDPNNPHVNQYEVTFGGFLSATKFVKETFCELGGDVLSTHEWKYTNAAARARARQLEIAVKAAANP